MAALQGQNRRDWLAATAVALLLCLLFLLPYALGALTAVPGLTFTGILMNPEDSHTYFAKMLAGYDGRWLYAIPFTPERPQPAFLGGFYILLGHLARGFGLSLQSMWHLARFAGGFSMFLTIFAFVRAFIPDRRTQWVAYLLAIFGSGLGWLLFLLQQPYWLDAFPVDFKMAEARPFFTALTFPHIAVSTSLMLFSFLLLLRAFHAPTSRRSWAQALLAGLLMLLTGILHPLLIYLLVAIWGLYWVYHAAQARRILWREGWLLVAAFALPGLLYAYYAYGLYTDPVLRAWDAQREGTLSPPWPHYLLAFGPYLLLAAITLKAPGAKHALRNTQYTTFLRLWILAAALLVYAPLSSQRRFVQGVHIPLAMFTAVAFTHILIPRLEQSRPWQAILRHPRYEVGKMRTLAAVLFILLMSLSNFYVFASVNASAVIEQPDLLFRQTDEWEVVQWLHANGEPDATLLGAYQTGNYAAAYTGLRVVVGHWAETGNFAQKEAEVAQFFSAAATDMQRQALLQQYDVAYVWHGPREQELGSFDPQNAPYLHPVYHNDTITIYAVSR